MQALEDWLAGNASRYLLCLHFTLKGFIRCKRWRIGWQAMPAVTSFACILL